MLRVCLGIALAWATALGAQDVSGTIKVVDGDTFHVGGAKVRLHGIDAPEKDQHCVTEQGADWHCGGWVTRAVSDRFGGQFARCTPVDHDRYGRIVGRCFVAGKDVGAWLVEEGMAFAYTTYSNDYVEQEKAAALLDRGLHAVRMQTPAQHRKTRAKGRIPPGDCKIKGNITVGGKIYHLPGQRHYERTGIKPEKGERWFCSEAAAQAAGWRPARR